MPCACLCAASGRLHCWCCPDSWSDDACCNQINASSICNPFKLLYGGAGDGGLRAYKQNSGETQWTALGHTEAVLCLCCSELWESVITGSSDGELRSWGMRAGVGQWTTLVFPDRDAVTHVAMAEPLWIVVAASRLSGLVGCDVKEGKVLWRLQQHKLPVQSLFIIPPRAVPDFIAAAFATFVMLTEDESGHFVGANAKVC
jgi:WD40 repeat protein